MRTATEADALFGAVLNTHRASIGPPPVRQLLAQRLRSTTPLHRTPPPWVQAYLSLATTIVTLRALLRAA
jgi:hypothetical protein